MLIARANGASAGSEPAALSSAGHFCRTFLPGISAALAGRGHGEGDIRGGIAVKYVIRVARL